MKDTFIREIQQQPEVLRQTFAFYSSGEGRGLFCKFKEMAESPDCTRVLFTGMGSSCYLSGMAALLMDGKRVPVMAMDAGELLHDGFHSIIPGTLLVCISQSGESYEITALLEALKEKAAVLHGVVGLSNDLSSTLAQNVKFCLPMLAGKEEATSTKTFVSTYLILLMLSKYLKEETFDRDVFASVLAEAEILVTSREQFSDCCDFIGKPAFVQCIGRGIFRSVTEQTALMFMEVTKIPSAASSGGAFRHGPIEAVNEQFHTVVYCHSKTLTYEQTLGLVSDILRYDGKVLLLTDCKSGLSSERLREIIIDCPDAELSGVLYLMPLQLILAGAARQNGMTPGSFLHGHKITKTE